YFRDQGITNPGRGWVMVHSEELTAEAITKAMLAGEFYASSGVSLESVASDKGSMTVRVAAQPDVKYTIRFVGTRIQGDKIGEIGIPLQESIGPVATYTFTNDELYVRATVVSSRRHPNGYSPEDFETAWAQPVVVRRLAK
ncbi:MAG TPA: histidinol-phosphatase, partial [Planctomycetota bacterium]|nr:histidinol-phosphatase [Planctomycetota bacterium]